MLETEVLEAGVELALELLDGEVLDEDWPDVDVAVLTGVMIILVPLLVPSGEMVDVIGAVMLPVPVYGAVMVT